MMNELSVEKINARTPYQVRRFEQDGSYRFITDHQVKLAVSFMYDDMIIEEGAYQLIIANLNNKTHHEYEIVKITERFG